MKVSWLKYDKDKNSFKIPEALGFDVYKLKDPEQTDKKIKELVQKDYKMLVVSDEIAGFSQDIITKYNRDKNVSIIIANRQE